MRVKKAQTKNVAMEMIRKFFSLSDQCEIFYEQVYVHFLKLIV
jgi:hypothetical protein